MGEVKNDFSNNLNRSSGFETLESDPEIAKQIREFMENIKLTAAWYPFDELLLKKGPVTLAFQNIVPKVVGKKQDKEQESDIIEEDWNAEENRTIQHAKAASSLMSFFYSDDQVTVRMIVSTNRVELSIVNNSSGKEGVYTYNAFSNTVRSTLDEKVNIGMRLEDIQNIISPMLAQPLLTETQDIFISNGMKLTSYKGVPYACAATDAFARVGAVNNLRRKVGESDVDDAGNKRQYSLNQDYEMVYIEPLVDYPYVWKDYNVNELYTPWGEKIVPNTKLFMNDTLTEIGTVTKVEYNRRTQEKVYTMKSESDSKIQKIFLSSDGEVTVENK